jgi:hypothetical protein
MSRSSTLILLGVLVILVPFSGLPTALRSLLAAILGACVLGIGLSIRAREARGPEPMMEPPPPVQPPSISSI